MNYKHVVLGIIFLKYVSDAFQERRDELVRLFTDIPKDDNIYYMPRDEFDSDEEYDQAVKEELELHEDYQEKIYKNMEKLLDTEISASSGKTLREEIGSIAINALDYIKQILQAPGKKNEKNSAEVTKILTEAEKIYAETEKIKQETNSLALENMHKKLKLLREFREMAIQLERDNWFEILDNTFGESIDQLTIENKRLLEKE